jgi:hypothetical protein
MKLSAILALCLLACFTAAAQGPPRGPQVVSPEVSPERKVTFRILAANADAVRLIGSDIPATAREPI